jgi:hypothetical protein
MPYSSIAPSARPILAVLLFAAVSTPTRAEGTGSKQTVLHSGGSSEAYVLARGQRFFSTNVSLDEIESLRSRMTGDFLWVRRGGKELVVRDPRAIDEAQRLFDPLKQLDPDREALGAREERLSSEETALEAEEEKLEGDLERLDGEDEEGDNPESARAETVASPSKESEAARAELERRRSALEPKMRALEARQREIDALERSLDLRSDALEAEAEHALWAFVEQAATRGLAGSLPPPRD